MKYLDIRDFVISNLDALDLEIMNGHSFDDQIRLKDCPYCHNGETHNPRSYIYFDKAENSARFHCYNNDCESTFLYKFIEKQNPELIPEFLDLQNESSDKIDIFKDVDNRVTFKSYLDYKPLYIKEKRYSKKLPQEAIDILKERKIYDLIDLDIVRWDVKALRIVFLFKDNKEEEYYYYQSLRVPAIKDYEQKYYYPSNKVQDYKHKRFFNLLNVDKEKPILITEGLIDSMFLDNSISLGGISNKSIHNINTLNEMFGKENLFIIQDFDEAGKSYASILIDNGYYVFQWKKFLKDNCIYDFSSYKKIDINDLYTKFGFKNKLKFNDIKKYFSNKQTSKIFL